MRNSALPFFSPFNETEGELNKKEKSKNVTIPNLAEEKKKQLLEAEQKRLAERKARTAEKIKEEGGLRSYRTRKLDNAKEERGERKAIQSVILNAVLASYLECPGAGRFGRVEVV